tara:strand:+ start:2471 stop:2806 length:336 start_codon:yes stop_codon:yes gene_type:complete
MFKLMVLIGIGCLVLLGCSTSAIDTGVSTSINKIDETAVKKPPSKVAENGSCMANTLSFLVGQPETALQAMTYPENTRILVHGQIVNSVIDPTRLNLVLGLDRNISFVYCG